MWYPLAKQRTPAALLALLLALPSAAYAEFVLNFQPQLSRLGDPEWLNFNCNRPRAPGSGFESCDENDEFRDNNGRDTTPFLMERIRDAATGEQYYHTIIGLPGDDFVQEAYIKIVRYMSGDNGGFSTRPQEVDDLGPISDSLGNWRDITEVRNNAYDPLGPASFSGSGTANPKSTQFRQVIESNGLYQEITKASFNKKHRIVETIDLPEIQHQFEMDMTNSTFDQANIAGILAKNQQLITQGSFSSAFDINNMPDANRSDVNITGGEYKYVQKYSTSMSGGPFENEYISDTGNHFNIWTEDWMAWRDPAQNPTCRSNGDGDNNNGTIRPRCHLYSGGGGD